MITYADDTVTYVPGKLPNDIKNCLNEDFNAIINWLESIDSMSHKQGSHKPKPCCSELSAKSKKTQLKHCASI